MKSFVCAWAFGLSVVLGQVPSASPNPTPGANESNPPLHEVFSDLGKLLRRTDPARGNALKARLVETGEEIHLLENLLRILDRGVMVEIPKVLREPLSDDISEATLEEERQRTDELNSQYQVALGRSKRRRNSHLPNADPNSGPSELARATLAVHLEIPVPPAAETGTPKAAAFALDPEGLGRSLYLSRDFAGALNAFASIPDASKSLEVKFLVARSLDRLNRFAEAKPIYEAVMVSDPKGHFGGLSEWMLRFGGKSEAVKVILAGKPDAPGRKEQ